MPIRRPAIAVLAWLLLPAPAQAAELAAVEAWGRSRLAAAVHEAEPVVQRWGYRRVLVGNTLALGLGMVSFVWLTAEQPLAWRLLQLAWFGAANSLQFSAMNTVTLQELDANTASSGNSPSTAHFSSPGNTRALAGIPGTTPPAASNPPPTASPTNSTR